MVSHERNDHWGKVFKVNYLAASYEACEYAVRSGLLKSFA